MKGAVGGHIQHSSQKIYLFKIFLRQNIWLLKIHMRTHCFFHLLHICYTVITSLAVPVMSSTWRQLLTTVHMDA